MLVHPGRELVFFVELKRHPNGLELAQVGWGDAVRDAGASWACWWVPDQFGEVVRWLTDRRAPVPPTFLLYRDFLASKGTTP